MYNIDALSAVLSKLPAADYHVLYDKSVTANITANVPAPKSPQHDVDLNLTVQWMRLKKSKAEIDLLQKAGNITSDAVIQAMRSTRPGMSENEIAGCIDYYGRKHGASMMAYVPVVAAGDNALSMHYVLNNQRLRYVDWCLYWCANWLLTTRSLVAKTWYSSMRDVYVYGAVIMCGCSHIHSLY